MPFCWGIRPHFSHSLLAGPLGRLLFGESAMNRLRQRLFVQALDDSTVPATFTVMNLNDSGTDSLRDCISKANAASGTDTVNFKAGLTGTITLTTGEIAISSGPVVIDGPGSGSLTISGGGASRIFNTSTAA